MPQRREIEGEAGGGILSDDFGYGRLHIFCRPLPGEDQMGPQLPLRFPRAGSGNEPVADSRSCRTTPAPVRTRAPFGLPRAASRKGCDLKPDRYSASLPRGRRRLAALALAALSSAPAYATLGGDLASVEADRLQMQATVRHASQATYTVHELTLANKGVVREYTSPQGVVFAVTWHGSAMPDLRQLLGAHFDALQQSRDRQRGGLGHFSARTDKIVITNTGQLRSFHGSAYLIDGLPNGVSANEIR